MGPVAPAVGLVAPTMGLGTPAMGLPLPPGRRKGVEKPEGTLVTGGGLCGAIPAPVPGLSWG